MDTKNNNEERIHHYLLDEMSDEERARFEAEMAQDEDLQIDVFLNQKRFESIRKRVREQMFSSGEEAPDVVVEVPPNASKPQKIWIPFPLGKAAVTTVVVTTLGVMVWVDQTQKASQLSDDGLMKDSLQQTKPVPLDTAAVQDSLHLKKPVSTGIIAAKDTDGTPPAQGSGITKEDALYQDRPDIAAAKFKRYEPSPGALSGGVNQAPELSNETAAYRDSQYQKLYDRLEQDSAAWKSPNLLLLVGNAYMNEKKYDDAIKVWMRLRSLDGYADAEEWKLALCYAARFSTHYKDLEGLAQRAKWNQSYIKSLLKECKKQ